MRGRSVTRIRNRSAGRAWGTLPVLFAAAAMAHAAASACTTEAAASLAYMGRTALIARELRVPSDYPRTHGMRLVPEAAVLANAGHDLYGRPLRLEPHAAAALAAMIVAARRQGVVLRPLSGYRSFEYQRHLVQDKLHRGVPLAVALRINAAPGFSEHHSGCAVDLATPDSAPADASFAGTAAYHWLGMHAGDYGFRLSYPAGNPHGIDFEPWHWRFTGYPRMGTIPDAVATIRPEGNPHNAMPPGRFQPVALTHAASAPCTPWADAMFEALGRSDYEPPTRGTGERLLAAALPPLLLRKREDTIREGPGACCSHGGPRPPATMTTPSGSICL